MSELAQVLCRVAPVEDPNLLVGHNTGDDAAVYRISADRALVATADFFTPIVDDPYDFGRIAAANSLSDVYAMGARPLFGLNLLGFPRRLLGEGIVEEVMRGGSDVALAAGAPIVGGHSIDDAEPKYGLVAVGEVHPDRLVTNDGAEPGDLLVLTKPLGSGIVATAIKRGEAPATVVKDAVATMSALNGHAAKAMGASGVRSATDVTGFGLLGHLRAMLRASAASATVSASAVPVIDGVRELAVAGHVPGGTKRNATDLAGDVEFAPDVDATTRELLCDAQTSGGMLICVPPPKLDSLISALSEHAPPGTTVAVIGRVEDGNDASRPIRVVAGA